MPGIIPSRQPPFRFWNSPSDSQISPLDALGPLMTHAFRFRPSPHLLSYDPCFQCYNADQCPRLRSPTDPYLISTVSLQPYQSDDPRPRIQAKGRTFARSPLLPLAQTPRSPLLDRVRTLRRLVRSTTPSYSCDPGRRGGMETTPGYAEVHCNLLSYVTTTP